MVTCEFEYKTKEDGKEVTYKCKEEAEGIARCKDLCRRHFNKLKQDNMHRINKNIDIPEDTSLVIRDKFIKSKLIKEV